jgi:hypothetical protein
LTAIFTEEYDAEHCSRPLDLRENPEIRQRRISLAFVQYAIAGGNYDSDN